MYNYTSMLDHKLHAGLCAEVLKYRISQIIIHNAMYACACLSLISFIDSSSVTKLEIYNYLVSRGQTLGSRALIYCTLRERSDSDLVRYRVSAGNVRQGES